MWSRSAAAAATTLTPAQLTDVLAVSVYPPAGPNYIEPWDWYFRVQVAAALIASHVGAAPWATARSRKLLEDVLNGPADWTNTAAAIALFDVARRDTTAHPQVLEALLETVRRPITPPVYQHAVAPAARVILELPEVSADVTQALRMLIEND